MALAQDQKDFIGNKVKELKTIEAVQSFYTKDDNVSKYAHILAEKLFKERRVK